MGFFASIFFAFIVATATYFTGKHEGYAEYFKGQIECKQAFEIIECKKVKDE